jgi:soluble lytic murein transglycosylase
MTKDGALPPENVVAQIESRFYNTKTGALAKLLHSRIRLEAGDARGAAEILNSRMIQEKTSVADYALWLRGKALTQSQQNSEAMKVLEELIRTFPLSLRVRDAKLFWAQNALQSGKAQTVPKFLKELADKDDPSALLLTAQAFEQQVNQAEATKVYRRIYFFAAGSEEAKKAELFLNSTGAGTFPQTAEEAIARADRFYEAGKYLEASNSYAIALSAFPAAATPRMQFRRLISFCTSKKAPEARLAFDAIPQNANEKPEAYNQLARAFASLRQWPHARQLAEEMRTKFSANDWTPKTFVALGLIARDQKNKSDENYFLRAVVAGFPNALDVAQPQFELAWLEHENKNYKTSSQMFIDHLARYANKDTTNRGRAGYWSARDSERAGKISEACALYDALSYRYGANWYGQLALRRAGDLRAKGRCQSSQNFPGDSAIAKAIANLKTVTVAKENSTARENERLIRADQLSIIGLFDWAVDELSDAAKTAPKSPKVNMTLANLHRLRGDNTNALIALARSYPDYSQMFPEEMSREEWEFFYPLTNWSDIKRWSQTRNLDPFQVAGLIRQESVFDSHAKSSANAFGLMQLLIPTARSIARKSGSNTTAISEETLYQPAINIELGTAYLRDLYDKFGRIEYVAVAYNAGPNRVAPWRASLPAEIDEFVEEIPFRETKGYVQGVVRNTAQYRRLYDDNGNFRANVGTRPLRGQIDSKSSEEFVSENLEIKIDADSEANN